MQRVLSRERTFLLLFENSFHGYSLEKMTSIKYEANLKEYNVDVFCKELFNGVKCFEDKIDKVIENCSKNWNKERLSRVSLCILRIAVYEILFREDIPQKVSANEAVNLAKKYGEEDEHMFVNGVLGAVILENEREKTNSMVKC